MSKKKQKKIRRSTETKKPKVAPVKKLEVTKPVVTPHDPLYQKIFKFSLIGLLIIMVLLAFNSGINGDDEFQNDYSTKLVNYYTTMGADTAALYIEKGKMHYYGGFFDLVTGLVNHAFGWDDYNPAYHNIRHLFNALFGWLTLLFVGLIAREIAGWRAAILAIFLLFFSPRFLGHSLMNPKDIPFAAGFAISYYYLILLFKSLPKFNWKIALGLTLGIALAIATRAGGLLLIAYLGLFLGLDFLRKYGWKGILGEGKAMLVYLGSFLGISLAGYVLAILTWPAALADPINHPLEALTEFSKLGVRIRVLFSGENILSDSTAWYYALLWIAKTIPLFAFIGFIGSFFFLPPIFKKYSFLPVLLLYFASIFPLAYVIYKDSTLHDGWRHLTFVYPSIILITSLFWITLESLFREKKIIRYVIWGVLGLTVLEAAIFVVRNPRYPYIYFNSIGGGLKGAFGEFELDYWGLGVQEAIDWMDKEGIIGAEMQDTVIIATNFYYNLSRPTRKVYDGKVRIKYVRFNKRYTESWDYGIFTSRFIRGPHLRTGNWPNSKAIHTVKANGVPIVAIEKEENLNAYRGEQAIKERDWATAIQAFRAETSQHPDNELAWIGLANALLNSGDNNAGIRASEEALKVAPDNETASYLNGLGQLRIGKANEALNSFQRLIAVNEESAIGYYYVGLIYQQRNELRLALENALNAVKYNPRFKAAYELVGGIYQRQGDSNNANRYLQAAQQL